MKPSLIDAVADARVLCFDLFHTLTSVEHVLPGSAHTADLLGVGRKEWHEQVLENSPWRLDGTVKDPFEIIGRMARAINPSIDSEIIRKTTENRVERFRQALLQAPGGSTETLKTLRARGKKTALVSNADEGEIFAWDASPLADCFDEVIFSCRVGFLKPDRRIFETALGRLGEAPRQCVFVGDGGAEELRAARELGFTTVMVTGYIDLPEEKFAARRAFADYTVRFVDELTGLT